MMFVAATLCAAPHTTCEVDSPQVRGVWVHPSIFGTGKDTAIGKIRRTLDLYQEAGLNTIMLLVKSTSGFVCYRSAIAPVDSNWKWDFVGTFIAEARKRSMEVHPWFCVFTEGARAGATRAHPEWFISDKWMKPTEIVNPSLSDVRRYEISIIAEFVRMYQVDWIHCDYIRFPCEPHEPFFSHDEQSQQAFMRLYGEELLSRKQNNSGNIPWIDWIEWNTDQVTAFMRELRQELSSGSRPVKISAAVFPDARISSVLICQDWARWTRERLVDMICPMLYVDDDSLYVKYLRRGIAHSNRNTLMCGGIGIVTAHNRNDAAGILRQIMLTKREKAHGFILFSGHSLTPEVLEGLKRLR